MKWLHAVLVALGAAGFVLLIREVGLGVLLRDAATLGWGVGAIVGIALLEHSLHSLAWQRCFHPAHRPGFPRLLGAYLAGGAINLVTPTATVGGELVRGGLVPRGVPPGEAVASVTVDRLAGAIADSLLGLGGLAVILARAPFSGWERVGVVAAAVLLAAGLIAFFALQRSGRLASAFTSHRLVRRFGGRRLAERAAASGADIDDRLVAFHAERAGAFRASVVLHALGTCVGALQVALFLGFLDLPVRVSGVLTIFLVGTALDLFSFFIPARLGAQEGARMLALSLAGFDAGLGVLLSLVLRVEQVFWAGLGLLIYPTLATRRSMRSRHLPPSKPSDAEHAPARDDGAPEEHMRVGT